MKFFSLALILLIASCGSIVHEDNNYDVRINFRFGNKFVSYKLNERGEGFAIKGHGSNYTDQFVSIDSTTSGSFRLDTSKKVFFANIKKLCNDPVIHSSSNSDGMRTEIYYRHKKIYDVYFANQVYWVLFDPIMRKMPLGYSPFRIDDNIFNSK